MADLVRLPNSSIQSSFGYCLATPSTRRIPHPFPRPHTLTAIAGGGIFDQLGGGFHRYSTDVIWLVPHFEKMLYDNALLASLYIDCYRVTSDQVFAKMARRVLDFVLRDLTDSTGFFFATLDADSEGVEGKFYTWDRAALEAQLPSGLLPVIDYWGATQEGNWEGSNILTASVLPEAFAKAKGLSTKDFENKLETATRILLRIRRQRVHPHLDRKGIISWNGMMIEAMARAGVVLSDSVYVNSATRAAAFLWDKLFVDDRLGHCITNGVIQRTGFLDDHAFFLQGLATLFEATQDPHWLGVAIRLGDSLIHHFWDDSRKTLFFTSQSDPVIVSRVRDSNDGAVPSASAMAVLALARLGHLTGNTSFTQVAFAALSGTSKQIQDTPEAYGTWILAADYLIHSPKTYVFATRNPDSDELFRGIQKCLPPNGSILRTNGNYKDSAVLKHKVPIDGDDTLYICEGTSCKEPIVGKSNIRKFVESKQGVGVFH